ncbi:MAG: hypothetical protein UEJ45_09545 [Peptococcaceae bacterium]|nr:hypothetical protein [Peptococcaceae bacterium]
MKERYSRVGVLDALSVEPKNNVSVVAGALLYDTMTQSKLIQLKFQNNSGQTLTGVLVKCVLYGENSENILGETFYQYEGLHVASGEAFGEQTPIAIQTQEAQAFDVVIVNTTFEETIEDVTLSESEQVAGQIAQDDSEAAFIRMDAEPSETTKTMDNAPKKKFSPKWLIAGAVLIGALLIAVFGSGASEPFIGLWTSSTVSNDFEALADGDTLPFEGIDFTIKRNGDFLIEIDGEDETIEGKWKKTTEKIDGSNIAVYELKYDRVTLGKFLYSPSYIENGSRVESGTIILVMNGMWVSFEKI